MCSYAGNYGWNKDNHKILNMIASCDPKPDPPSFLVTDDSIEDDTLCDTACDNTQCSANYVRFSLLSLCMTIVKLLNLV